MLFGEFKDHSPAIKESLFNDVTGKGLITWNAMINGYAQNGLATDVLELYRERESCGDTVTLAGVLSSCAHLGAQVFGRDIEKRITRASHTSDDNGWTQFLELTEMAAAVIVVMVKMGRFFSFCRRDDIQEMFHAHFLSSHQLKWVPPCHMSNF